MLAGPAVAELAASCSGLTVLVTSRSALNVRGEREVSLQPHLVRSTSGSSVAPAAVVLFCERAEAVGTDLGGTTAPSLAAEICARLDGLPLAIELAAARTRHMPLADLLRNLDHRLDLLVGGARDLPARQQAMRTTLDWSYALLDAPQMSLFRGLSVFRGSFGQEAAQAVAALRAHHEERGLVAALSALVDASLLAVQAGSSLLNLGTALVRAGRTAESSGLFARPVDLSGARRPALHRPHPDPAGIRRPGGWPARRGSRADRPGDAALGADR